MLRDGIADGMSIARIARSFAPANVVDGARAVCHRPRGAPGASAASAFGDSLDPRAQLAAADIRSEEAAALFRDDVCGHREDDHPLPRVAEKPGHIFVSIASYRDERCKITLADLFAKAAQPERITVAVVQQNDAGVAAEDCIAGCLRIPTQAGH
jgi:hypothetical protein